MSTGYITVKVFTAEKAMPVPKAQIRIVNLRIALDQTISTDLYGNAERIKVYAPDKATSLKPQDISQPYETYNIEIMKEGYIPTVIKNVPVFAGETCLQPVAMIPQPEGKKFEGLVNNIDIPPNGLQLKTEKKLMTQTPGGQVQLKQVTIPDFIRVHMGEPDSDDKTVLVPFTDYVKNAASSEIYATWPKESLVANILAIISFALNRIYTGYYTAQGKDFDVTSVPERDPYFVDGRNIYENICDLVDGIFNRYIRRTGFNEPLLANYCNGITARCEGISQWGSVTLANQGQSAEDILKYYYGNVQTETSKNIQGVEKDFPGGLLRLGDVGENVMTLQKQLNLIGKTYGNIPAIPKENGNYDAYTQDAVRAFQKQFSLDSDGIVGKKTWYQIEFVYNNIKRLLNLSRMRGQITVPTAAPTATLRPGSSGGDVRLLQYLLSAAGLFYNSVLPVSINGNYDQSTEKAVRSFQKTFVLPQSGNADAATWSALLSVYSGIEKEAGSVLDNLRDTGGEHIEERRMQPSGAETEPSRTKTPDQRDTGEMMRGRKADQSTGRGPGRDETRNAEERVRTAMNYANMDYKAPPRGTMNMAYTSEIKDYVPDTGMNREYLWAQKYQMQDAEKTKPAFGQKTGAQDTDQMQMGASRLPVRTDTRPGPMGGAEQKNDMLSPEDRKFQYTPWMTDHETPSAMAGGNRRQAQPGSQDMEGGQDMTGGYNMEGGRDMTSSRDMEDDRDMMGGRDTTSGRDMTSSWDMMSGRDMEDDRDIMSDRDMMSRRDMAGSWDMMSGRDMTGSRSMTGGRDMDGSGGMGKIGRQGGMQGRQGKPWDAMDDTMESMHTPGPMDQEAQMPPYASGMMEEEAMITRPGTRVTPHRQEADTGLWGTEQMSGGQERTFRDARIAMQQEETAPQGRQPYPIRMPGMPTGMPGQPGVVLPGDDGDEEYRCPDPPLADPVYPNTVLKIGSKGKNVQLMQEYLSFIALSLIRYNLINNELKVIVNDGIYGIETTDAVIRFQNRYEMPVNGVIDAATWAKIIEVYNNPCE